MTQNKSRTDSKWTLGARLLVAFAAIGLMVSLSLIPAHAQGEADEDRAEDRAENDAGHVIRRGETLSSIAAQYGVSMQALMEINGLVDPNTIVIGQELRLPDESSDDSEDLRDAETDTAVDEATVDETATSETKAGREPPDGERIASLNSRYTVQSGDILGLIALRAGVDLEALSALNNLPTEGPIGLVAGETLILPATENQLHVNQASATYTVEPGDVLGVIANEHGFTMAELMKANFISDPNLVTVGQELIIPPSEEEEAENGVQVGPHRRGFYYYTVQSGDTLSEIANEFDTTMLALLEFNNLPDEETVYRGLDLSIPYGPPNMPQRLSPAPLSGTSFLVSLSRQECWLFEGGQVKERWICSTGYGDWITRTGAFSVQSKIEKAESSAYELDMPYWLGLYDVGDFENGIHGLPVEWKTGEKLWEGYIGQPATFGCAMLADEHAVVLYNAAYLGMPVYVMQ